MIIDGHAHSCGQFFDPERIVARLTELNADKVVLCPGPKNGPKSHNYIPDLAKYFGRRDMLLDANRIIGLIAKIQKHDDLLARNEYVYSLHQKYPERIIQFFWANPNSDQIETDLHDTFESWQFKGIKLHQCAQNFELFSRGLDHALDFAREKEIPVFIHLRSRKDVHRFITVAQKYPTINFIIAHLIGMETFLKHKRELNNLYFDVSPAPFTSPPRICEAIRNFGANKLILGSDTPFGQDNLRKNIQKVSRLKISSREIELILGNNLRALLSL
ncbi:MAG: amidohydrolase family protein [Peptococcaceae bacterium]|jgi:predicted TIM-barrel fold metal-dependent hydrolase|nr:amidohydrolase family protein [Peptococcaceae bacterium]